jgi:hypothetical protein
VELIFFIILIVLIAALVMGSIILHELVKYNLDTLPTATKFAAIACFVGYPLSVGYVATLWSGMYDMKPYVTVEYDQNWRKITLSDTEDKVVEDGITIKRTEERTTYENYCVVMISQDFPGLVFSGDDTKMQFDAKCRDLTVKNYSAIDALVRNMSGGAAADEIIYNE